MATTTARQRTAATANGNRTVPNGSTFPGAPTADLKGKARADPALVGVHEGKQPTKRVKAALLGQVKAGWWAKYEVPRKALHSSIGLLTLYLNHLNPPSLRPLLTALSITLAVVVFFDLLRLNFPSFARVYERYLGLLMRAEERHKPNGVIWYLVGVLVVLGFYPRDVAVLSILILSWVDTAASTLGRLASSKTNLNLALPRRLFGLPIAPSKSVVGFLAAWATGTAVAVGYYGGGPGGGESRGGKVDWRVLEWRRGVAVTGTMVGFVAAVTEALDVGEALDDNLTLPIVSGALVWAWLALSSHFL